MSEILSTKGLSKSFGPIAALTDVSLSLGRGEIRAICGENGAGKSTLVKLLMGVYRPDSGVIEIEGVPRTVRSPQQAQSLGLALVVQELSLAPHLSVLDNIWLGSAQVPLFYRRAEFRERALRAVAKLRASMEQRHPGAAEPDIVEHREVGREAQLLHDQRQSQRLRLLRTPHRPRDALDLYHPGIRTVDAHQEFDQRALAGAVLSANGADLATTERQGHVAERSDRPEALRQTFGRKDFTHD